MPYDRSDIVSIFKHIHLFQGFDDASLESAADYVGQAEYADGDVIFQQGAPADTDYFYIIANGQVRLSCDPSNAYPTGQVGLMSEEDYFGEEVLESNWPRQVTATAAGNVSLLTISVPDFINILAIIPTLTPRLQFILNSYRLKLKTHLPWLEEDETVLYIARRHVVILLQMIVPPLLVTLFGIPLTLFLYLNSPMMITLGLLVLAILFSLGWGIWQYVDWSNDYNVVTNQRVVYQEKIVLLYDSRQESPMWAVQSTTIRTTQWGRWLGFGNVDIRTFYGTILFKDIGYPEQVMTLIQQNQMRAQFVQRKLNIDEVTDYLHKRITEGPERPALPGAKKPQTQPDPIQQFISTMFHLRYKTGNTIIYRTHLFILLTKIWLPTLLLIGLLVLFLYSASSGFSTLSAQATCGLTGLVGLVVLVWWFYQYMDWHNDLYLITVDQVVDVYKKPLGREERQSALIKNILSIEYKRLGIIGRILNFGTVYIRVGDKELTFDDVYNPSEVQREVYHAMARVRMQENKQKAEADRRDHGDWFASYHKIYG